MGAREIPQDELLRDCEAQLAKIDEEARGLAGSLTPAQLQWSPPGGGWSVAQVFAHLAASNDSYLPGIRAAIERERASGAPRRHSSWRPSLFGGMLIRSLDPSTKRAMPTPKIWRPSKEQPAGTLDAFLRSQTAVAELVRSAAGVDLVRARASSPVSRLIRLNLGDVFRVLVVHDWRHLGQVRRIMATDGFPSAPAPQ